MITLYTSIIQIGKFEFKAMGHTATPISIEGLTVFQPPLNNLVWGTPNIPRWSAPAQESHMPGWLVQPKAVKKKLGNPQFWQNFGL